VWIASSYGSNLKVPMDTNNAGVSIDGCKTSTDEGDKPMAGSADPNRDRADSCLDGGTDLVSIAHAGRCMSR
jgi:hypothetical protein